MTKSEFNSASVETGSPCIRNCCLDENDICMGCHRSLEEILIWHKATDNKKNEILALCQRRQQQRYLP
ncbi:MAG: DUF1289 domain-containing protein [Amphritea sp.]|nr:DUF1289 domain-containing protein [Amphritea sp.]MBQ0784263.1 DUF1289 domain-containing protein [Amphritea sp.]